MTLRDAIAANVAALQANFDALKLSNDAALQALGAQVAAAQALSGPFEPWLDLEVAAAKTAMGAAFAQLGA